MGIRVAADVGGTFTDVVAADESGRYVSIKLPSTPGGFETAVGEGVARALAELGGGIAEEILHATTVATNAILERSGPPVALITTRGFRDVLEIGRLRVPNGYDLGYTKPVPLARRRHRLEVAERTSAEGEVLLEPDLEALGPAVDGAVAEGVGAFAVSLLNSYANPANERAVAAWLAGRYPGLPVTAGTDIVREAGEFERTSTAVVDAYLKPVLEGYLEKLSAELGAAPILVMQSSGGMLPAADARDHPVRVLESGPAAGALAAARIARRRGIARAVAFDMGGTTAKACLIENGEIGFGTEFTVGSEISAMSRLLRGGGYTVRLTAIDLAEVGAGGGSLARVDAGGALVVGPQSAGARPGPACYGRGGTHATVTDANLMLGYVSAEGLRGGGVEVSPELAAKALERDVARPLGLSVAEAAEAVHRVADQQMARALRAVTTERGHDLSAQTLIAFGGGGPMHAASLAEVVGIRSVVVPPLAGVLSAVGLLDSVVELSLIEPAAPDLDAMLASMEAQLRARLPEATIQRTLEMAFRGQGYQLAVEAPSPLPAPEQLAAAFRARHQSSYGHQPDAPVEVVRVRVVASAPTAGHRLLHQVGAGSTAAAGPVTGPTTIHDAHTTTVVPAGWTAVVDADGTVVMTR